MTLTYLRLLDRSRYRPILLVLKAEGELLGSVPEDVLVAFGLSGLLRFVWQADVIIGALELTATYVAVLLGSVLKRPVIGWVHSNLQLYPPAQRWYHRFCLSLFYPWLNEVLAVSHSSADSVCNIFPRLASKTQVLEIPIDLERVRKLAEEKVYRLLETPMLLGVGILNKVKSFDNAIRIHAALLRRKVPNHLVILGSGPEELNLLALAQELGVSDSVFMLGYVDNPYQWMDKADVFVLTSRVEGLSSVVIEALALGKLVVSTDCPGGLSEFDVGEPEAIVPVDDVLAMTLAVQRALEDKNIGVRFAEKGPQIAGQYRPELAVRRFEEFLQRACCQKNEP